MIHDSLLISFRYTLRSPLPDTKPFEEYIVTHHRSHPFADFWLDLIRTLGNTKNASEILRVNIAAIRQNVTVTRKQTRLRQSNAGIEFRTSNSADQNSR